ncbi:MAG: hypothetical protein AAFV98_05770 [Chloroflexota bacterium]
MVNMLLICECRNTYYKTKLDEQLVGVQNYKITHAVDSIEEAIAISPDIEVELVLLERDFLMNSDSELIQRLKDKYASATVVALYLTCDVDFINKMVKEKIRYPMDIGITAEETQKALDTAYFKTSE